MPSTTRPSAATSAALTLSGIPFLGPIGAARVGYTNGEYSLNPSRMELEEGELDLVVAGTEAAVLMVESEAQQLTEEVMLGAVLLAIVGMRRASRVKNGFALWALAVLARINLPLRRSRRNCSRDNDSGFC